MTAVAALTIRDVRPDDRPAMLDLWVEAWKAAKPEINFESRRDWLDGRLDAMTAEGTRVFVAEVESGAIIGFVTVDRAARELDQLVIAVEAQGRGTGQALLRQAKQHAPQGLSLTVNQFNHPAIRLYRREGFVVVGQGVNAASGLPVWHMCWPGAPP